MSDIVSSTICVGNSTQTILDSLNVHNHALILNPIDTSKYKKAKIENNKKWAFVTRLDNDKTEIVKKIIQLLPDLDIAGIDIYGDGNCFDDIEELTKNCSKSVVLKGHVDDVHNRLMNGYSGVIGIGRCAIEGLSLGLPVLFAGYGKICGIIDSELYKKG